jgi:hypothetical protein
VLTCSGEHSIQTWLVFEGISRKSNRVFTTVINNSF